MPDWQLAQINVGRLVAPEGDPRVAAFYAQLDAVNAVADASPGFIWRLVGDGGNATGIRPAPDDRLLVNMSVWADIEALSAFVFRSAHAAVMMQRRDWFERFGASYQALWWVPAGHRPGIDEGLSRLWLIDRYGPCPQAFSFAQRFAPPA